MTFNTTELASVAVTVICPAVTPAGGVMVGCNETVRLAESGMTAREINEAAKRGQYTPGRGKG